MYLFTNHMFYYVSNVMNAYIIRKINRKKAKKIKKIFN